MKTFLIKSLSFFLIIILLLTLFLHHYGGYVDYFYNKFTTPKASSMIIGDSRALQGLQPAIINEYYNNSKFDLPIFNYSFTISQGLIGSHYRKSILKKIDANTKKGLFIIAINPWMLGSKKENNNYKGEFKESGTPPHNMNFISMNPNFEYLLKNYNYFHFKAVFRKKSFLHKDGWLEENNLPKDSLVFKDWKKNQINMFTGFIKGYKVSEFRKKSLDTLIKDLKKYGQVYLVSTPIDKDILEIENRFYPDFDKDMDAVSKLNSVAYFNFNKANNQSYATYDGHHIDKFGGKLFTKALCDSIMKSL
ncbi:MAG: hypothetical protein HKO01_09295 [Flaviramulus sp.]|nr:hypothetical protein [Flaviramulus sp.]NNC50715.1 hypothetical protein [Flaviramulus sp.]